MGDMHCKECSVEFEISPKEVQLLSKLEFKAGDRQFSLPIPDVCPKCRVRQRFAFRNQRTLHQRNCDLCHKSHVTLYSADDPRPVYCQQCFFSDKWNVLDYGLKLDLSRPFMDQLADLFMKVPRLGKVQTH